LDPAVRRLEEGLKAEGGAMTRKSSNRRTDQPTNRRTTKRTVKPTNRRTTKRAAETSRRAAAIVSTLKRAYPQARCALEHHNAYELIVATILSAQCTDARVNMVTPAFFTRYPDVAHLARAGPHDVEVLIQSTGFFRNKTRNLIAMAQAVVADHKGEIPRTMAELHALPGVGRKTANVVLGNAFGINEGITVDTHVTRLAGLLRLTRHTDPVKIERDLMALIPRDDWTIVSHLLILHGRNVCIARRPRCDECAIRGLCPSARPAGSTSDRGAGRSR
jgi:endonuclease-3